ncbi:MAG: urate hydroxylase PuuD [Sphaerotilus natans subsp. sulfidivorans]|uniref:urate hydroxylase PuuD n=1 Tax=Sphaerotilus sulfidivorans TaxID=639200 RepID=UPI0023547279|nr:urate hydroxylase PuuD [Sphaerotilus sulfidivorans]MCK6401397.1 urate hydroxylase PuuD [Sphaerotilus sulfidivorans]
MDIAYLFDWLNLLLRWAHVITAIAWIGASFYFVMLDNSLSPPTHDDLKKKGVDGEMWAVHGGGFYHSNKYMVAPRWLPLPQNLHWSYWESYSTWLTGFGLFTTLYLYNAGTFLVDKTVFDWTPGAAIGAALGFLAAFWLIYDGICRTLGQRKNGDIVVGICVFVFVVFASWLACQLFAGRAAFLLVGAMLATAMSANVFFWIIPGQRKVVASLRAGETPDPVHGRRGKQRSVHNTYFTLPVLIAMISNHYGWLYQGPDNWLVLVLLMLAGALIRHSFVARHKAHVLGKRTPWEHAVAGTLLLLGLAIWLAPPPPSAAAQAAAAKPVTFAEVKTVIDQRCVMCHNAQLQNKNIALHTPELIQQHAQAVYQQTSVLKLMPMNNATQITEDERALIRRWFEAGAPSAP